MRASTVAGGSATANVDYTPTSVVLTFAPGETGKYFEVPVAGQPWGEPSETVNVLLTEASGASLLNDSGVGVIISSVLPIPTISMPNVSIAEGNAGSTPVVFTLSLSAASGEPVTVPFHTENGTAIAGQDYESVSGILTFSPGSLTRTVRVMVKGNTAIENDRVFYLALGLPTNATKQPASSSATIRDDDFVVSFSADPVFITKGGSSTLLWSAPPGTDLSLNFQGVTSPQGSQQVSPLSSQGYELRATLAGVVISRFVRVTVVESNGGSLPTVTAPVAGATALVSGVTLAWTAAGVCGYDLQIFDGGNGSTVFSGSLSGAAATSTLVSLPDGKYLFAVRACDTGPPQATTFGRWGSTSFDVRAITPAGRPTVTQPIPGASLTQSTQTLSWTPVAGDPRLPDLFYEVLLEDIAAGLTALQITVPHPATSTIFTLASSAEYRLRVRACQAGCGAWSDPVTFSMALPGIPTGSPSMINCSVKGGNSLTCDWGPVAGADAYRVQVVQPPPAGPGGGALTVAARQLAETHVTLLVPSGNSSVFVAACNGDGCGPYAAAPAAINPSGPNPATPNLGTPMGGTVVEGPGVFFAWNRVPGDDGTNTWYRLFVQDLSRQSTALDILTKSNFYAAFFKAEGARYDARIVAKPGLAGEVTGPAQGFNVGGASATAPTMVAPAHNGIFAAGNLQLGWTPVPGAALYEYFVSAPPVVISIANGVTTGLFIQVPFKGSGTGLAYSAIVRACLTGSTCGQTGGWGPWSNAPGGPGVTNFTVIP